jgi:hypothetical protein
MAKVGRPAWIPTKEDLEKAELLAARGLNQEQIADCLGIGASTLFDKKNEYPEFAEALKKGRAQGIAHVTQALFNNIDLGNVTAQIFYLKTVGGWREAKDVNLDTNQSLIEALINKL